MEEVSRLWTVFRTVIAMINARNYIPNKNDMPLEEFKATYGGKVRDELTMLCTKKDDPTTCMFVFFCDEMRVGCKQVKEETARARERRNLQIVTKKEKVRKR